MKCVLGIFLFLACSIYGKADFYELMGKETSRWRFVTLVQDQEALKRYGSLYERQKEFQNSDNQDEARIPRDIHLIWLGPKPFPHSSVENIRMWVALHPDWHFHFWTDRPRLVPVNGLQLHFVDDFPFEKLGDYFDESINWGQKSDLLRYEILERFGGVYIDHDANCLHSFEGLNCGYDFFCCLEVPHTPVDGRSITAGIGIVGARAHHPVIQGAIQAVCDFWEPSKKLYPATSPKSLRDYVMHSTYLALTRSLEIWLDKPGNRDIVFPASYFYPQKGLQGIYSHHYYGTSWADIENEGEQKRAIRNSYHAILKHQRKQILFIEIVLGLSCLLLAFGGWRWARS